MATETPATQTAADYITHHITNWTVGEGFWSFNVDTFIMGGLMGLLSLGLMAYAARRATSGVPGGLQNFVEIIVGFVDQQVKDTFHAKSNLVTPLAITVFVWIWMMNALDLVPIDFVGYFIAEPLGAENFKAVATTDINA